jgi:hypothetical protein
MKLRMLEMLIQCRIADGDDGDDDDAAEELPASGPLKHDDWLGGGVDDKMGERFATLDALKHRQAGAGSDAEARAHKRKSTGAGVGVGGSGQNSTNDDDDDDDDGVWAAATATAAGGAVGAAATKSKSAAKRPRAKSSRARSKAKKLRRGGSSDAREEGEVREAEDDVIVISSDSGVGGDEDVAGRADAEADDADEVVVPSTRYVRVVVADGGGGGGVWVVFGRDMGAKGATVM